VSAGSPSQRDGFNIGELALNKANKKKYGNSKGGSVTKTVGGAQFYDRGVHPKARYCRNDADFASKECKEAVRGAPALFIFYLSTLHRAHCLCVPKSPPCLPAASTRPSLWMNFIFHSSPRPPFPPQLAKLRQLGCVHSEKAAIDACKVFDAGFNSQTYPEQDCLALAAAGKAAKTNPLKAAVAGGGAGGAASGGGGSDNGLGLQARVPFAQVVETPQNGQRVANGGGGGGGSASTAKESPAGRTGGGASAAAAGASSMNDMDHPPQCACGSITCLCASRTARDLIERDEENVAPLTAILSKLCLAVTKEDGPLDVLKALAGYDPKMLKEMKWGASMAYKVVTELQTGKDADGVAREPRRLV